MSSAFSAKETAHKIEVLARDIGAADYDSSKGCSVSESALVQELKSLQADPEHLKAVKSQMLWDNLKPNDLPYVRLEELADHQVELQISDSHTQANIDSGGRVYNATPGAVDAGAVAWTIANFDKLDKDKNGILTESDLRDLKTPFESEWKMPSYGSVLKTDNTISYSYGYRATSGFGFHLSNDQVNTYGITKDQLKVLLSKNSDTQCK
jgi:hypothetical protein